MRTLAGLMLAVSVAVAGTPSAPRWAGDPEAQLLLEAALAGALASTEAFGPWPPGPWMVHLHTSEETFERATGAPGLRAAAWVGSTLHLRPWLRLRRRDLGALLRHEMVHRRLAPRHLRAWEEEARCLWAQGHPRPPEVWPPAPEGAVQDRLDRDLRRGTTSSQAWAYAWLRAWLAGRMLPGPTRPHPPSVQPEGVWRDAPRGVPIR